VQFYSMHSTVIPVNIILKNPAAHQLSERFIEVTGRAECLLSNVIDQSREYVDVRSHVDLVLTPPDEDDNRGRIAATSFDRARLLEGEAVVLEKRFAVSGRLEGLALSLVFKLSGNQVDISHMRLLADDGERDLSTPHVT